MTGRKWHSPSESRTKRLEKLAPALDEKLSLLIETKGYKGAAGVLGCAPNTLDSLAYGGRIRPHVLRPIAERLEALPEAVA